MDESHRLKPMAKDYNEEVFLRIYNETKLLRQKLAFKIDHRKFGVENCDILAALDIKFIWSYNKFIEKYGSDNPGNLKGYVINSLTQYQYRLMISSYTSKNDSRLSMVDITDLSDKDENYIKEEQGEQTTPIFLEIALGYLKTKISDNAFMVLETELNPPDWILNELEQLNKPKNTKIPSEIIAEYFDYFEMGNLKLAIDYVKVLRKEIKKGIEDAQRYFTNTQISLG